jgi:hypothetical protein
MQALGAARVRWSRRIVGAAVGLALAVGACGSPSAPTPSPFATAPGSPTVSPSGPGASPTATLDPAWLTRPALTCGGDERFPAEALIGAGSAELGGDPAATALRAFLAGPDAASYPFPARGWSRVFESPTSVVFVARGDRETPWVVVAFETGPAGTRLDRYGECQARLALPDGIGPADFWVDPAAAPGSEATTVAGFIRERSCASGRSPEGRVLEPLVVYGEAAILIAYAVQQRPGGQDCPSNPPFAVTLELAEPIGDRVLLDGGTFPPRDALVPPD